MAFPNGSSCTGQPGASAIGVTKVVFSRDYDFTGITCGVTIGLSSCCRNGAVLNLTNPGSVSYWVSTQMMDPSLGNHGPTWLDPSFTLFAQNQPLRASMAAYDQDGDSLVYYLDTLWSTSSASVPYTPGYDYTSPLGWPAGPYLDKQTGTMFSSANTTQLGQWAVGVLCEEYRDGQLIGRYNRDFTILVIPGQSGLDLNPYLAQNGGSAPAPTYASYIDTFTLAIKAGVYFDLPLEGLDFAPTDTIYMSWSENLPGATWSDYNGGAPTSVVSGVNPVAKLRWMAPHPGRFAFNVKLEDSVQYALGHEEYSFILVADSCSFSVDIGPDTVHFCAGDTVQLNATSSGALGSVSYAWWTGDTSPSISITQPGVYAVEAQDSVGCRYADTVYIFNHPNCVWPGDADNDGIADNNDLLALGLTYGDTGPARANASLVWIAQPADDWSTSLPSGTNAVYSDTDGNGVVNDDDTLAISLNYGLMHNKTGGSSNRTGATPFYLLPLKDSVQVGDTLKLEIMLGVDSMPADSIYGVAFTIVYDPSLVDSGSARVSYGGWLGTYGTDLIGLQKDFYSAGRVEVAMTRTDMQTRSGYGMVGGLSIVMIDDIVGKNGVSEDLIFDITNVRLIGLDGANKPIDASPTKVVISEGNPTSINPLLLNGMKIYPQPAADQFVLAFTRQQVGSWQLVDLQGRQISAGEINHTSQLKISTANLSNGLYLLRVETAEGKAATKVQILR
ncbi:MAG: T9SS type A sorting domain-containing protein [Bacteroidota bacterium]